MDKLTDLELEKRIAEIEGYGPNEINDKTDVIFVLIGHATMEFSPLTDKAMLLDLILKYKVQLSHCESMIDVRIYDDPEDNPVAWIRFSDDTTNFSRFVLLCIAGANNG